MNEKDTIPYLIPPGYVQLVRVGDRTAKALLASEGWWFGWRDPHIPVEGLLSLFQWPELPPPGRRELAASSIN